MLEVRSIRLMAGGTTSPMLVHPEADQPQHQQIEDDLPSDDAPALPPKTEHICAHPVLLYLCAVLVS